MFRYVLIWDFTVGGAMGTYSALQIQNTLTTNLVRVQARIRVYFDICLTRKKNYAIIAFKELEQRKTPPAMTALQPG